MSAASESAGPWWRELNRYHWWVLTVATLGWLFDGMDQRLFVLARTPALQDLMPHLSESAITQYAGYATMIFILGWATGGLFFGLLGDRLGRTKTMMITILIYAVFTGLSSFAQSWWDFAAYRFFCGLGIGGEYAAGIALVAEVVPERARPYCLGLLQGLGALGHLIASWISIYLGPESEVGGWAGWRVLFLLGVLPALLVIVIRFRLKEPDRWVQASRRADETRPADGAGPDELHRQLGDFREIFRNATLRYHLIIGLLLALAGQTGLWGIGYWTPELVRSSLVEERRQTILETVKFTTEAERDRVATLPVNELAALVAADPAATAGIVKAWKAESDQLVGRGTLLQDIAGMFGIYAFTWFTSRVGRRRAFAVAFLLALGATWITFGWLKSRSDVYWMLPLLGFCVASIYGGYAIYFPELFPTRLRSTGVGICYNVARYLTAFGSLTLGKLAVLYAGLGHGMPLRPAAMTLAVVFLVGVVAVRFAPETKGRPLPE
ncbi:MAG: MFS transporter [Verrucomicrobia bacterium]|nr:MFS transporter [Verrucomicrobiota bacterium]